MYKKYIYRLPPLPPTPWELIAEMGQRKDNISNLSWKSKIVGLEARDRQFWQIVKIEARDRQSWKIVKIEARDRQSFKYCWSRASRPTILKDCQNRGSRQTIFGHFASRSTSKSRLWAENFDFELKSLILSWKFRFWADNFEFELKV